MRLDVPVLLVGGVVVGGRVSQTGRMRNIVIAARVRAPLVRFARVG